MTEGASTTDEQLIAVTTAVDDVSIEVDHVWKEIDILSSRIRDIREELSSVQPQPKMTPAIAKAITQVKSQVKSLAADAKNQHGGYRYTTVDAFYEAIGPLMAAAGLILVPFERSVKTVSVKGAYDKMTDYFDFEFDLYLYGADGSEFGPVSRKTRVVAGAAQAFAAASSFIEKYFLRSLFRVPTGDEDAEEIVNAPQHEERPRGRQTVTSGRQSVPESAPSALAAALDPDASAAVKAKMLATLAVCDTRATCLKWATENSELKASLTPADQADISAAFVAQQDKVKKAKATTEQPEQQAT